MSNKVGDGDGNGDGDGDQANQAWRAHINDMLDAFFHAQTPIPKREGTPLRPPLRLILGGKHSPNPQEPADD